MKNTPRWLVAVVLAGATLVAGGAAGQTYPLKPVRIVVPFPPGGNSDRMARLIGHKLAESWGQSVLVENRPGAGGTVGSETVARAAPDGHTLLLGTFGSIGASAGLYKNLPYDPIRDFAPITLIATPPLLLVVHPSLPVKSVRELVSLAGSKPRELTYASSGNGSSNHLFGKLLESLASVELVHIPYKGSAPALTDVLAGRVHLLFAPIAAALPQVRSGKLRALAVSTPTRSPTLPDVQTLAEGGVRNYQAFGWDGLLAPARTPQSIVTRLHRDVTGILQTTEVRKHLAMEGAEPIGSTPAQFSEFIASEVAKWTKLIKELNVTID